MAKFPGKIEENVKDHKNQINNDIANHSVDLGLLTADILEKKSSVFTNYKERATHGLENIQDNFLNKGEQLKDALNTNHDGYSRQVISEYEHVLRNAINKLRGIAEDDFNKTNENTQVLISEAKTNIKKIVAHFLNDKESRKEFSETAEEMLNDIHKKIRKDFHMNTKSHIETTHQLSQRHSNIFVMPAVKPQEEIEAEKLLQQYFEVQLLDYADQFQTDFKIRNDDMSAQINNTKYIISGAVDQVIPEAKNFKVNVNSQENLLNLPTRSNVEKSVATLLNKAKADFNQINENIKTDVAAKKEGISSKAQFVAEKIFGKDLLGFDDEA